jgi:hypothetical protein
LFIGEEGRLFLPLREFNAALRYVFHKCNLKHFAADKAMYDLEIVARHNGERPYFRQVALPPQQRPKGVVNP